MIMFLLYKLLISFIFYIFQFESVNFLFVNNFISINNFFQVQIILFTIFLFRTIEIILNQFDYYSF